MPLSLAQGVALVADTAFQARVAMGFYYVARQVITEDPQTPGHEVRERFARSITGQPYANFQPYAAMVVTDPTIIATSSTPGSPPSDALIIAAIAAMFSSLAGVSMVDN